MQDEGRCEGGVSAKVDFDCGREPAEVPLFRSLNHERCFREIILHGDFLHQFVREPIAQWANASRIPGERPGRESVNLEVRKLHEKNVECGMSNVESNNAVTSVILRIASL